MKTLKVTLIFLAVSTLLYYAFAVSGLFKQTKKVHVNTSTSLSRNNGETITAPCAVAVSPTLKQIDEMKSKGDTSDFYEAADDNQYYMAMATEYLDSVKLKVINKEANGIVEFKIKSGRVFRKNLNKAIWNIILFNGKDEPMVADITNIDEDYKRYMKK